MRQLFRVVPAGDMFQWKIDKIFKGLPNVFGIADDILIVGYDAERRDHDETLKWVRLMCQTGKPKV